MTRTGPSRPGKPAGLVAGFADQTPGCVRLTCQRSAVIWCSYPRPSAVNRYHDGSPAAFKQPGYLLSDVSPGPRFLSLSVSWRFPAPPRVRFLSVPIRKIRGESLWLRLCRAVPLCGSRPALSTTSSFAQLGHFVALRQKHKVRRVPQTGPAA
jgi:hypothetical protein